MSTTITASCGYIYDTTGKLLRIGDSALSCTLPRGHAGPHHCVYAAHIRIANTGPTGPREAVDAR